MRPAELTDLADFVVVLNNYWRRIFGVERFNEESLRSFLTTPGYDIAHSTRIVFTDKGELVAGMIVADLDNPPVHPQAAGSVLPDYERRGLGTALVEWAEERCKEAIVRCPAGARVAMHCQTSPDHHATVHLFEQQGMQAIRYFYFMVIDLDSQPPEPVWPDGIVIRTYAEVPDMLAVYRATEDSFRDHWGTITGNEEERVQRWKHRVESDPDFDPSLWYLAYAGDEIAAINLCSPTAGVDASMGYVETLGVRRPWRRQGLAQALLYHAFNEFYRRGKPRVSLGVDASSLTGATRLYEKVGMHVALVNVVYEKELRPGKELATESLGA
jgi:mycothiol synthase